MGAYVEVQVFMLAAVLCTLAVRAAWAQGAPSQAGFISIDCGAKSGYVDQTTGIVWAPDTNYIFGGEDSAQVFGASTFAAAMTTLRYFPKPHKHCYKLPDTTPNASYMIRHTYWYGNYDGLMKSPTFTVAFDSAEVFTVNTTGSSPHHLEHIYKARKSSITFCLYRHTTNSTPFISSLELRPLHNGVYDHTVLQSGGIIYVPVRLNMGAASTKDIRFPDDVYDRIWMSWTEDGVRSVETSSLVDSNKLPLMPPSAVMQTAFSSATLESVTFLSNLFSAISQYFYAETGFNLYFAEIGSNSSATSRAFSISLNKSTSLVIENPFADAGGALKADVKSFTNSGAYNSLGLTLIPLPTATTPPLLNAVEILFPHNLSTVTTDAADVSAIEMIKQALNLTLSSAGDPCLPIPIGWITCSPAAPPRVTGIELSNYNLTGEIPAAFGSLTALTLLHLENNFLSGTIPATLGGLSLRELFLQNNELVGTVPDSLLKPTLRLDLAGNPGINDPRVYNGPVASPTPNVNTSGGAQINSNIALIGGVVGGIIGAIVFVMCVVAVICARRKKDNSKLNNKFLESLQGASHKPIASELVPKAQQYSYAEIVAATNVFKRKIGAGGFGLVYYGRLPNGNEVAIKSLDINSCQGAHQFTNEVELLSKIHHKNLVKLIGYCEEGNHQMLVYEFLHKGTIQEHLYGRHNLKYPSFVRTLTSKKRGVHLPWSNAGSSRAAKEPLDLKMRLDIALNSAQGLEYLHNGCNPKIIHRDIKSNNILLTDKYVAKVADFGLSKLITPGVTASHVVTGVKGTIGYLDPEYYISNALTEKSDVFSFGVVLLEILCGRPSIDQTIPNQDNWNICNWVRALLQTGDIDHIVDLVILKEHPNMEVVWKVAELAMQCVEPKGKHRPSMQDVVRELRDIVVLNSSSRVEPSSFGGSSSQQSRLAGGGFGGELPNSSKYLLPQDSSNSIVQPQVR